MDEKDGPKDPRVRFEVRPNPSRSSFLVKYSLPAHVQNGVLTVRDQLGRLLYKKKLSTSLRCGAKESSCANAW